jgi:hypothetical protein
LNAKLNEGYYLFNQEIWLGLLHHVRGVHEWRYGQCLHGYVKRGTIGDDKPVIKLGSVAYDELVAIVDNKKLLSEFRLCVHFM